MYDLLKEAARGKKHITVKDLKGGPSIDIKMGANGCKISELLEFTETLVKEKNKLKPHTEASNVTSYLNASVTRYKVVENAEAKKGL